MRALNRLTSSQVANAKRPGKYLDGGGLILHVRERGSKQWLFRYQRHGRQRAMGFGSADTVTLKEARERAHEARRLIAASQKAARQAEQAAAAS